MSTPHQIWQAQLAARVARIREEMVRSPDELAALEVSWPAMAAELRSLRQHLDAPPPGPRMRG